MKTIMKFRNGMKEMLENSNAVLLEIYDSNKTLRNTLRISNLIGWLTIVLAIMYIDLTLCKVYIGITLAYLLFYIWICGFKSVIKQIFLPWYRW